MSAKLIRITTHRAVDAIRTFEARNPKTGEILRGEYANILRIITKVFASDILSSENPVWIIQEVKS